MTGKHCIFLLSSVLVLLCVSCLGATARPSTRSAVENITKQIETNKKTIKANSGIISEVHSKVITNETAISTITNTEQHSNNPWPWMIASMVQLPLFLAFLWFSRSFPVIGRK